MNFAEGRNYFSLAGLKHSLDDKGIKYTRDSIKQTLYYLKKDKVIFSSGRGWYSSIATPFRLEKEPVQDIVNRLKEHFPYLPFACWSTQQIRSYFHHLPGKYVTFIYTESDALGPVHDYLREDYTNIYVNPNQGEVRKSFAILDNTVVLRQELTEEPRDGYFARIEKILVDLHFEKERLYLIDGWEYDRIFENLANHFRIDAAKLIRYAQRRKIKKIILDKIY